MNKKTAPLCLGMLLVLSVNPVFANNKTVNTMATNVESIDISEDSWFAGARAGVDYGHSSLLEVNEDHANHSPVVSAYIAVDNTWRYAPNMMMRFTNIDHDRLEFQKYDYIGYYNLLDTGKLTFNLGAALTRFAGGEFIDNNGQRKHFNEWEPSIYADAKLLIPNTKFSVIGDMQFGDTGGNSTVDVMAGMQYGVDFYATQINFRTGYRVIEDRVEYFGEPKRTALKTSGFFGGIEVEL